jgi:hypothetical protein
MWFGEGPDFRGCGKTLAAIGVLKGHGFERCRQLRKTSARADLAQPPQAAGRTEKSAQDWRPLSGTKARPNFPNTHLQNRNE